MRKGVSRSTVTGLVAAVALGALTIGASWFGKRHPFAFMDVVRLTYEVDVDHPFVDRHVSREEVLARVEKTVESRLAKLDRVARARIEGTKLVIDIPRIDLEGVDLSRELRLISKPARVELKCVDDDSDQMRSIAAWWPQAGAAQWPGVTAKHESWAARDDKTRTDIYLAAADEQSLDRVLAALPKSLAIPSDHQIVYEKQVLYDDVRAETGEHRFRTYYIRRAPEISNDDIEGADLAQDPMTRRYECNLVLTREAAKTFEGLTARITGHRLAILLDDKVTSAPVVETRIRGGRVRISFGDGSPEQTRQDASDLIAVLRGGALDAPIRLVNQETIVRSWRR